MEVPPCLNEHLSTEDQRNVFDMRNNMTNIPLNFKSEKENTTTCICGEKENMIHIYNCEKLNTEKPREKYENIFGNNVKKIRYVLQRFNENLKEREKFLKEETFQEIQICDPLHYRNVAMNI